jgi:hypothetical protein
MSPGELTVTIAPHLKRALEVMGRDMAVEPQALVNQAVFAWLRINGYVVPGTIGDAAADLRPVVATVPADPPAPDSVAGKPAVAAETSAARARVPADAHPRPTGPEPAPVTRASSAPAPEVPADPGAVVSRIEEIEADLERFTKPRPAFPEVAGDEEEGDGNEAHDVEAAAHGAEARDDEGDEGEDDAASAAPSPVEPTVAQASSLVDEDDEEPPPEGTFVLRDAPVVLYIERDGEEAVRVEADHFVIGRGPHCDLIIDSPRVSREHARVFRQGLTYVIEDLGSSNGTWYGEERVRRRELESGDEFLLGNERVRFVLRGA